MSIERKIDRVKEILMWIFIAAVAAGIFYAEYQGQTARTPGGIIYEKTNPR